MPLIISCFAMCSAYAASETDQLIEDGLEAYKAGDYDVAIGKYTEAIQKNPKNDIAYNDRGLAYKEKKDFKHAIADFTEGARLKPNWSIYYNRGIAYHENGNEDSAIADFTKALKLNPTPTAARADCLIGRAHAYFNKEKAAPAMADLNATIKLGGREAEPYVLRGILHKVNHDYERSLADYETAVSLEPLDARSYNVEAYLLSVCPVSKYRDAKKAIAYATKSCHLTNWKDASYVETLAAAYAEAGQFDEAIKFQTKAAEIDAKVVDSKRLALYQQKQPYRELNRKGTEQAVANLANINEKLVIEIGQQMNAQLELKGDQLVDPKIGLAGKETPNSLWLDFRKDKQGHVLFLWHSFTRNLQARCLARLKDYDTYFETDILPVPMKVINRELWNEPIEELVLFDFKLIEAKHR